MKDRLERKKTEGRTLTICVSDDGSHKLLPKEEERSN